jgi:hypothetical protein
MSSLASPRRLQAQPATVPPVKIPEAEWQQHKNEIIRFYIDEKMTLAEVMNTMATKYTFYPT